MEIPEMSAKPNIDDTKVVRFRKPFADKYTLTITTDLMAGSFPVQTKAQVRWALRIIDVDNIGRTELELVTVENKLLETNNPNLADIAALSQAFARMYSEIQVKIDAKGKILEIINLPLIIGKWEQTKAEMQAIENEVPAIGEIIKLNDEIFANPDNVKLAIEHNEFFSICFHLFYGEPMPNETLKRRQRNMFNSAENDWRYLANSVQMPEKSTVTVNITGKPEKDLDDKWIKEAYGNFGVTDTSQINPQLSETGQYQFQKDNGKLLEAVLIKEETAHPEYVRGKMVYEIKSDNGLENHRPEREPEASLDINKELPRKYYWERN